VLEHEGARGDDSDADDRQRIIEDWFREHYSAVSATANGSIFHRYMHQQLERRFPATASYARVLELGANRGEHVPFVTHQFEEYIVSDLRLPELPEDLRKNPRISLAVHDAHDVEEPTASIDRLVATCLLHHVDDPLRVMSEMRRVVRPGGVISVLIPGDPGIAYRLGKYLTTGRNARRLGIDRRRRLVDAIDHRNHFASIRTQAEHVFRDDHVVVDWAPFRLPSWNLNAFAVLTVRRR
jgi:phosphatidylethanolamine/phosphatidyl-N-methylethanolamine N-methyltransferase